jgi:hypothetical protein
MEALQARFIKCGKGTTIYQSQYEPVFLLWRQERLHSVEQVDRMIMKSGHSPTHPVGYLQA